LTPTSGHGVEVL